MDTKFHEDDGVVSRAAKARRAILGPGVEAQLWEIGSSNLVDLCKTLERAVQFAVKGDPQRFTSQGSGRDDDALMITVRVMQTTPGDEWITIERVRAVQGAW